MDEETAADAAVAESIRQYLRAHPHAADTLDGIAHWWLPVNTRFVHLSVVQRALDLLELRGEVKVRRLSNGRVIYERGRQAETP